MNPVQNLRANVNWSKSAASEMKDPLPPGITTLFVRLSFSNVDPFQRVSKPQDARAATSATFQLSRKFTQT
jgi:hypothetical protein